MAYDYDPNAHRAGYLPATDYALPHLSRFTVAHDAESHMLRHASCGLLSTPGVPPTLLALKQHAQSLAYLIAMLEPHGSDDDAVEVLLGRVDAPAGKQTDSQTEQRDPLKSPAADIFGFEGLGLARKKKVTFADSAKGSTKEKNRDSAPSLLRLVAAARDPADHNITANPFDWLDFRRPYTNDEDPDHHRPLLDLVNEVRAHCDVRGTTTYHCPLTTYTPRGAPGKHADADADSGGDSDGGTARPYASHHNLLMHANMCLERLDHEYAATGGLLSLLPTTGTASDTPHREAESPQLAAARNTLVGQWLVFTQQLVARAHELEISFVHAIHLLSGETVLAPHVRKGSVASFSKRQALVNGASEKEKEKEKEEDEEDNSDTDGRWILANAGDSVWSGIHDRLDKASVDDLEHVAWRHAEGVVGERALASGVSLDGSGPPAPPDNHLVYVDVPTRCYRTGAIGAASRGPIYVSLSPPPPPPPPESVPVRARRADPTAEALAAANVPLMSASALERRYDGQLREAARVARENARLAQRLEKRTSVLGLLQQDHARLQKANAALEDALDRAKAGGIIVGDVLAADGGPDEAPAKRARRAL